MYIDSLTVMLLALAASSAMIAYFLIGTVRGKKDFADMAPAGFMLALFDFISGFYMSFFWPLPGPYNMLFGDPLLFLGMILLAGSFMLYKGLDIKILSMPGVFLGIYLFAETYGMVAFNLEKGVDFLPAFGLYLLAAIAAVASPLVYLDTKSRNGRMAYYFLAIMFILIAFIALFIGSAGIVAHLASPP